MLAVPQPPDRCLSHVPSSSSRTPTGSVILPSCLWTTPPLGGTVESLVTPPSLHLSIVLHSHCYKHLVETIFQSKLKNNFIPHPPPAVVLSGLKEQLLIRIWRMPMWPKNWRGNSFSLFACFSHLWLSLSLQMKSFCKTQSVFSLDPLGMAQNSLIFAKTCKIVSDLPSA